MDLLPAFAAYLESLTGPAALSPLSRAGYTSTLRVYLSAGHPPDDLAAITAYLAARLAKATAGSAAPWRTAFKHWCRFRTAAGVPNIEADDLTVTGRKQAANMRDSLESDELAAYRAAIEGIAHPSVVCLLTLLPLTGLRIHEICKLQVNEYVARGKVPGLRFVGKRGKERWVPLSDLAAELLAKHTADTNPTRWIFPALGTDGPMRANTVRKLLRKVRDSANWTPHVLRHTFASNTLDTGGNLAELQAMLGHEKIETTAIYVHPSASAMQRTVNRVAKV